MKKLSLAAMSILTVLLLAGCQPAQQQEVQTETETIERAQTDGTDTENEIALSNQASENCIQKGGKLQMKDGPNGEYSECVLGGGVTDGGSQIEGTWQRLGDPAVITIKDGTYVSSGACLVNGVFTVPEKVSDNEDDLFITLTITSTNCENVPAGLSVTYQYEITEDEKNMTWSTSGLTESFVRS